MIHGSLLAKAFAVQEVLVDARSGAVVTELLDLVRAGKLDLNNATHLVADCARNVANAAGVAVGVLSGDQLLYKAGSGSAADLVGRKVAATLSVSTTSDVGREILRVNDAQTEHGIGAAICRQFEVRSLLILPIHHNGGLAGVLEVFFTEAHTYVDCEMFTYQLMTRVIGEAMDHSVLSDEREVHPVQRSSIPQVSKPSDYRPQSSPNDSRAPTDVYPLQPDRISPVQNDKPPLCRHSEKTHGQPVRSAPWNIPLWRIADWSAMAIALVTATWIASAHQHAVFHFTGSQPRASKILERQPPVLAQKVVSLQRDVFKPQRSSVSMVEGRKVVGRTPRRVAIGQGDYFSGDVIVRHFRPAAVVQQVETLDYVEYVSEDVTVRRFNQRPAIVSPSHAVAGSASSNPRETDRIDTKIRK